MGLHLKYTKHLLSLQARVFQNSKCALSGAPLELPAVHFACGHSYNLRSLGENEKECPICAPQFRAILDIKKAMRSGATEQVCTNVLSVSLSSLAPFAPQLCVYTRLLPSVKVSLPMLHSLLSCEVL